ncbi:hypothetical protein ABKN59_008271 [Abortiporus biennis]
MTCFWKANVGAALLLTLAFLPEAHAFCYIDGFGIEHCRLSNGARAGIAIGLLLLGLFLIFAVLAARRRRVQRANLTYVNQTAPVDPNYPPNGGYPQYYGSPYVGNQGPQYPPKSYTGQPAYDPTSGFAPPQGPPPQYYPPPQGPPPGKEPV